jgi:hypothetical protein
MKQINTLTTAEMVAEYNALTGKAIKKFSSRAAGEKQLAAARVGAIAKSDERKEPRRKQADRRNEPANILIPKEETKMNQPQESKQEPVKSEKRSIAISESWADKKIAAKRARRDNVLVEGVGTFRSVCEAFKKLNLPMNQHIKFRMHVKTDGSGKFEMGGKTYNFQLVEKK